MRHPLDFHASFRHCQLRRRVIRILSGLNLKQKRDSPSLKTVSCYFLWMIFKWMSEAAFQIEPLGPSACICVYIASSQCLCSHLWPRVWQVYEYGIPVKLVKAINVAVVISDSMVSLLFDPSQRLKEERMRGEGIAFTIN